MASDDSAWVGQAESKRGVTRALVAGLIVSLLATIAPLSTAAPARADTDVGFRSFSYTSAVSAPTSDKPQSKLWFNDGRWWGSLYNPAAARYEIHRFDWTANNWSTTGVAIDARRRAHMDVLWDGAHLYVASAGTSVSTADDGIRVSRYSYSPGSHTYSLDAGFPVTIVSGGTAAVVMDKDSTGVLWLTYTRDSKVWVARSNIHDASWNAPYVLPLPGASNLLAEDISTIVQFNGKIGVMWSNQNEWVVHFGIHIDAAPDSAWTSSRALSGPEYADNHINIKSLQADPSGQVFAAVKTSLNNSSAPLMLVLIMDGTGGWQRRTFGRVADDHTRPLVLIDGENRHLYVFATTPCCSGGAIVYKRADLDNPQFDDGIGDPFIQLASDPRLNNVASTKQVLNRSTGLLVIAGDDSTRRYAHNKIELGGPSTPETTMDSGPQGTVPVTEATFTFSSSMADAAFECRLDAAPFAPCASPATVIELYDGEHTFEVRAIVDGVADPTPASQTWTVDTNAGEVTVTATADAEARSGAPAQNLGGASSMAVDSSPASEAFLRFDVPDHGRSIAGATLRILAVSQTVNGPAISEAANNWVETEITWNSRPALVGPILDDRGAISSGTWVEFDVSDAVDGPGTYSFALLGTSSDGVDFASREAVASSRPHLVVALGDSATLETTINSGPSGIVNIDTATFTFSSDRADATFECSLDDAPFTACDSPLVLTDLADGSHHFAVRALDPADVVDPSPATASWTVAAEEDSTPPTVSLSGSTTGALVRGMVLLSAEAADDVAVDRVEFVVDGVVVSYDDTAPYSVEWDSTTVDDGTREITARAVDASANATNSDPVSVTVDNTAPETVIDFGPTGSVSTDTVAFAFSASEPGTFECALDGAAFGVCAPPLVLEGLADGTHTFAVRAIDAAGNIDPTPATQSWTVDTGAPLFSDGFESGDFSAWSVVNVGGTGTATVQGEVVADGTFAARLSATSANGSFAYARRTFVASQPDLTVVGDFNIEVQGSTNANVPLLRLFDAAGTRTLSVYRQNGTASRIWVNHSGANHATSGTLRLNTWGNLEVHTLAAGAGASTVRLTLDGQLVYETTTASLPAAGVHTIQIGNETAKQTFTLVADSIEVH